ncbi:MAG TPA: beta-ketoacyl-ACP synthase II [Kiritimatiellia bacterium]|nr:beta-ketoacyl-ACP synthase II [Kiritimatiellia bacterium]HOR74645.1 beta-ketoacyl-ACP synthase II [Kiritimatiellia bacterium]HOU59170.1 beta-ketoacyl-ACP synthase II [Kiritimatiellia bacterium]HPK69635.1 beta-ketoacyl-ACP synthase II [Kiritimatiellia bacterium]HQF20649.1 beta-ketoacyl-ACP synthase II [Kiritimatiellia bacterium]
MAQQRRVVVTGLGVVSPVGSTVDSFWAAILAGQSGIGPITYFDASAFDTKFAGQVKGLNLDDFIPKKEQRRMDPFCHYGVSAAKMAMADSGLDMAKEDPTRIGVIAASGVGGLQILQAQMDILRSRGPGRFSPFMIPQMITNILPGLISINHGLKGPNFAVVTACASGTHCIGEALNLIRCGAADAFVAGGAEGAICELGVGGFNAMRALSTRNDSPTTASRPFDKDRDGFVMGEGAGMLVIEEYEHAKARGARIYCELAGFGCTGDAFHITAPDESASGPSRGMMLAMQDAGVTAAEIDYINAHGTSTELNDAGETKAIKIALGEADARRTAISSTKSMTGHLLGAAGGVESVACCLAIRDSVLPPTINYTTPDPACDLDYVPNEARPGKIRACLNNSLGFGGHNATLCFKAI